jgi:hypothetical protein
VILVLIGIGVFLKQSDADMSRFGITEVGEPKLETPFETSSLVPPRFETISEVEIYIPENLYEKIDGKAPLYIESGFEKLFTQRFVSKDDQALWMELFVYDMGSVKNAFSVFSVQRRADAVMSKTLNPQYAYRTGNALYFVRGHYYIELVGSSESNELFKAMTEVSDRLRKKLAVDTVTEIAELNLFPPNNIVQGSIKLYLTNTFGFEGLTDTLTAQYKIDDETITVFFSKRVSSKDAEATAKSYRKFLIENGAVVKKAYNKILADNVMDFYNTTEVVLSSGPFVVGIHESENQESAEKLAVMLINKLTEVANNE